MLGTRLLSILCASAIASLAFTGCAATSATSSAKPSAPSSTEAARPAPNSVTLGKTTLAELTQKMGPASKTANAVFNNEPIEVRVYSFAGTGGEPLERGVIPARNVTYYFHKGVLIGESFSSSFKSDHTNFDDSKVPLIVKGKTTRAEVAQLFGRPGSVALRPIAKAPAEDVLVYSYSSSNGQKIVTARTLRIGFDAAGVAQYVEQATAGTP